MADILDLLRPRRNRDELSGLWGLPPGLGEVLRPMWAESEGLFLAGVTDARLERTGFEGCAQPSGKDLEPAIGYGPGWADKRHGNQGISTSGTALCFFGGRALFYVLGMEIRTEMC